MDNKEITGNWIFDEMNADELREYAKAQSEALSAFEGLVSNFYDRCEILSKLVNNLCNAQLLSNKHSLAVTKLNYIDSEMNNKYMDDYLSRPTEDAINNSEPKE